MKSPFRMYMSSPARRYLMGREDTVNPTPAAERLLGKRAVRRFKKRYPQRAGVGRSKHNPAPAAIIAGLSGIKKLFNLGGSPRVFNDMSGGGPLQTTVNDLLLKASQGDAAAYRTMWQARTGKQGAAWTRIWNEMVPNVTPAAGAKWIQQNLDPTFGRLASSPASSPASSIDPRLLAAGTTVAGQLGRQLISSATRPTRSSSRKVRQVVRYDPDTGDKYKVPSNSAEASSWPSRKPTRAQLAGLGGGAAAAAPVAAKAAGLAGAGAGAIAGVVIGGLAVGVLIGTGLRKLFGTARAVRAEEAAVQGAIALRNTRTQLEQQLGRKLNATEARALFNEYTTQLEQLGFIQDAKGQWYRPRSAIERFLG